MMTMTISNWLQGTNQRGRKRKGGPICKGCITAQHPEPLHQPTECTVPEPICKMCVLLQNMQHQKEHTVPDDKYSVPRDTTIIFLLQEQDGKQYVGGSRVHCANCQ